MFQVDDVIAKQFPSLINKPLLYKSSRKVLSTLLHESDFQQFSEHYPHLQGLDFVEQVLDYFSVSYSVRDSEKHRIPSCGRLVVIANHPIGSLDALALIKLICEVRSDIRVMANHLLSQLSALQPLLVPVDNIAGVTTKQSLQVIKQHLSDEGVLLIFPAGEVSRLRPQGIRDTHWHKGFLKIAKSYQAPILPCHLDAKNSAMFYSVSMLYKPLSSFLLIKEMFKQRKQNIPIRIGELIPHSSFSDDKRPLIEQVKQFKKHLYAIGEGRKGTFHSESGIALPEDKATLYQQLKSNCTLLGETKDNKQIYLYQHQHSSVIMREIGRLREIAFRAVGEGTHNKRDIDKFDSDYLHLILWDKELLEIVGAYRFGHCQTLLNAGKSLYSETLFEYKDAMKPYLTQGLELGRSFVQPKYWGKRSLDYLWYGIGAYLKYQPNVRYLFGPVSISGTLPATAKNQLVQFYRHYFNSPQTLATARNPYHTKPLITPYLGNDYQTDFALLKRQLAEQGVAVPTLYKQYSELCEMQGVRFLDFGVDPNFNDCVDGLVLVDLHKLKHNKRKRYLS